VQSSEKLKNITITRFNIPNHQSGFMDQSVAFIFYAFSVFSFVKNKDYDLVVASSSRMMTAFLGALISNKKKIKLFLDIRDIFLDTIEDIFSGIKKIIFLFIIRLIENYTINKASIINLVSIGFKNYFKKRYPSKKLLFCTNGIDPIFLKYSFTKTSNNKNILLYAGNIGLGQGLDKIIPEIAKELKNDWDFVIIGDGGRKKDLISKLKLRSLKNVFIINPVKQKSLLDYYNRADVLFLHLNDFKAFEKVLPSKIFEYAATEKPILAGVSGYAKIFIEKEIFNAQIFTPCDSKSAIEALKNLKLDQIDRTSFKKKFNRKATSHNLAKEIIQLIQI